MVTKTAADLSVTTDEPPHATRLRESFSAFGQGDLDTVRARLTDNCIWTNNAGSSAIDGQTRTDRYVLVEELTTEGKVASTHNLAFDQVTADTHFNR